MSYTKEEGITSKLRLFSTGRRFEYFITNYYVEERYV